MSACAGAQSAPVVLPSRKYAFESGCKVQICWLQVSKYHPRAELWQTGFTEHSKNFHLSPGRCETNLRGTSANVESVQADV